jgi:type II secretion system protein H
VVVDPAAAAGCVLPVVSRCDWYFAHSRAPQTSGSRPFAPIREPHQRAFTLIELILVMSLLLIVTAVSAPQLATFFRGRTLDAEARRFLSLTRYGQSRAVSEGVPMVLWVDAKQGAYGLEMQPVTGVTDDKAVAYLLDEKLEIEAELPGLAQTEQARAQMEMVGRNFANVPGIVFTPEGFVSQTSPEAVQLREGGQDNGEIVWVALGRNRLNYEIQTVKQRH